jgi:hypothetical protein
VPTESIKHLHLLPIQRCAEDCREQIYGDTTEMQDCDQDKDGSAIQEIEESKTLKAMREMRDIFQAQRDGARQKMRHTKTREK